MIDPRGNSGMGRIGCIGALFNTGDIGSLTGGHQRIGNQNGKQEGMADLHEATPNIL
jgi:hypothetical protein